MNKESLTINPKSGNHLHDLLSTHPQLEFNRQAYEQTCAALNSPEQRFKTATLPESSSIQTMLTVVPVDWQAHFMTVYIGHTRTSTSSPAHRNDRS